MDEREQVSWWKPFRSAWWKSLRFVQTRRAVAAGNMLPRGYGVAYYRYDADVTIAYPIPLNLLVGWSRWLWIAIAYRMAPDDRYLEIGEVWKIRNRAVTDARDRGYDNGVVDTINVLSEGSVARRIVMTAQLARFKRDSQMIERAVLGNHVLGDQIRKELGEQIRKDIGAHFNMLGVGKDLEPNPYGKSILEPSGLESSHPKMLEPEPGLSPAGQDEEDRPSRPGPPPIRYREGDPRNTTGSTFPPSPSSTPSGHIEPDQTWRRE